MNRNITFMTLVRKPWAISADWSSLLSLVQEGTHYEWYSDEAKYYEGDYNFAYIYHFNNKWWVSEHVPFKEGGSMGLEEVESNRYCLGEQMTPESLDDALCSIAENHWMREQKRQVKLEAMQSCSPCDLYLDAIPF